MNNDTPLWIQIAALILGGSFLAFLKDIASWLHDLWKGNRPEVRAAAEESRKLESVDQNIVLLTKTRDELDDDNKRIREERDEARRMHAEDRAIWQAEKVQMREEIDLLLAKVRALVGEVESLKERHAE